MAYVRKEKKKEKKKEDALITLGCGYFVINTDLNLVPRESKVLGENYFVTAVLNTKRNVECNSYLCT